MFCRRTWPWATSFPSSGRRNLDLPELLRSSLLDRDREHLQPARAVGTEEVRSVRDLDSLLAAMVDRLERARGRERLDYGRVETAVDDPPG